LRRVTLWTSISLLVVVLGCAGGLYLWYQSAVSSSNARVAPEVLEALGEGIASPTGSSVPGVTTTTERPPDPPSGMNLVLIGSDTRSSDGKGGRSDTIILLHADPESDFLSMLSIPRDLRVNIPDRGYGKINAAYAYGGAALLIRTVQSALGVDLDHYAEVDFGAFKEITETLGGVYVDVDRYYDDGAIELSAGYQLLDGQNALRFCRTRHDKNIDFGRMARQQRFLSAVREQAIGWNLAFKLPSLVADVFDNVDTDLTAEEIISLAYWMVRLDGRRTKMIGLIASTGTIEGASYVLATDEQIQAAVADFLTVPAVSDGYAGAVDAQWLLGRATLLAGNAAPGAVPNIDAWQALAGEAGFPLLGPSYLPPRCAYSYRRSYLITVGDETRPAIKVGYRLGSEDQYLGVGETTWLEAPIASPGVQIENDGVVYTVVGTSTKIDHVWWIEGDVLHWVSNTLLYELPGEELLAVALSATPVLAAALN
jgi:LCP family protein required for cell wall assembly